MRLYLIRSTLLGHASVLKKDQHRQISTLKQVFGISVKREVEKE